MLVSSLALVTLVVSVGINVVTKSTTDSSKKARGKAPAADGGSNEHHHPKMTLNTKPRAGRNSAWDTTNVIVARTACNVVKIMYTRRPGRNQSGFTRPFQKQFQNDPEEQGDKMKISLIVPRRDNRNHDADEAMYARPDASYLWWSFVYVSSDTSTNLTPLGEHYATCFTKIANESSEFRGDFNKFVFLRDETTVPPRPVNYYMRNEDTIKVLKMVYSNSLKQELQEDASVMEDFFGSLEEGSRILSAMTDDDYNIID